MDSLPNEILDDILFKLDLKSLAMLQCTDRSIKSYISKKFKYEYVSRMVLGSVLFHISTFGSNIIFWHTSGDSKSRRYVKEMRLKDPSFLGSCAGLHLLLLRGRLCVRSPLTSTCTFVDLFKSKLLPHIITLRYEKSRLKEGKANCIGFAVDQIKQQFKIICVNETREKSDGETVVYQFEIHTGDPSWRLSETTMTCLSSKLMPDKKSAYFNGFVHWLREDGSILAFNMETEAARLIPTKLPQEEEEEIKMLAATHNKLTLITETERVVCVYALLEIVHPSEWVIMKRYDKAERVPTTQWNVAAYDRECLMVREKEEEQGGDYNGVVHVFDLEPKENYIDQEMITDHIDGMSSGDMKYYLLGRSNRFGNRWFGQVEPPPKLRMVSQGCKTREKSPLL
ncbi:unnamed protein product [Cochlearia groenlandica]